MEMQYKILPKKLLRKGYDPAALSKAAVIAHLYYDDKFDHSMQYLRCVPNEVDVYIITANPLLLHRAEETVSRENLRHFHVISKPNRGRDFGTLLVTAREILPRYEYIGFIHDKKCHVGDAEDLGETWERCLFEAVLGAREYFCNIISTFEENPKLGVLSAPVPPEPFLLGLRGGLWTQNYNNAVDYLKELDISCLPDPDDDPLTIGSAFWFRQQALEKLIRQNLRYEDFPPEPMPTDGCIAHVLERIIGYVSEAAGFYNSYVMSDEYAEYFTALNESYLTKAISTLRERHLLRFQGNRTDMDMTYQIAMGDVSPNELENYCSGYRRTCLILEKGYQMAELCREEIDRLGVAVKGVFYYPEIDIEMLRSKCYAIVVCVSQGEQEIRKMLHQIDRQGYYYKV